MRFIDTPICATPSGAATAVSVTVAFPIGSTPNGGCPR